MSVWKAGTPTQKSTGILAKLPPGTVTAFLAALVYLMTLAPTITWENRGIDSGELAVAAYYLGVAHPTGYPLFVVLGFLVSHLPVGTDPAYRLNLLSAIYAAGAAGIMSFLVHRIGLSLGMERGRPITFGALFGGMLLAVAPLYWSQGIITEVYALHALLIALVIMGLMGVVTGATESERRGWARWFAFFMGLSLSNHMTALFLAPGGLILLGYVQYRHPFIKLRDLALGSGLFLLGLSPYLLLPIRGRQLLIANWGAPSTWGAFIDTVTATAYRPLFFQGFPWTVIGRLPALARMVTEELSWPGFLLATLGLLFIWEKARPLFFCLALFAIFQVAYALQYIARDSEVHLIPFLMILSLVAGLGLAFVLGLVQGLHFPGGDAPISVVSFGGLLALALIGALMVMSWGKVNIKDDYSALEYAQEVLESVPDQAVILSNEDRYTFSLWYAQWGLGIRQDAAVVDTRLINWSWYSEQIVALYPHLPINGPGREAINTLGAAAGPAEDGKLPVYSTFSSSSLNTEPWGPLFRVKGVESP